MPLGADWIDTDLVSTIGDATLEQLGAPPGSLIDVLNGNGQMYIVQVAGGIDDVLPRLEPGPLASAGADLLRLVASLANGNQHPTR